MFDLFTTLSLLCICVYLINRFSKWSKLPPGPIGVPFLGYLPFLGNDHHITLSQLSTKYGNVFSLRLGFEDVVVLNDWKSIKEGLNSPHLLGRPKSQFGAFLDGNEAHSLVDGQAWKDQRRLSLKVLHDVGFAKQTMEDYIKNELEYLLNEIDACCGNPMDIGDLLQASASNVITCLVFGHRLDYTDPVRHQLNAVVASISGTSMLSPLIFIKSLVKLIFWLKPGSVNQTLKHVDFIKKLTKKEIQEHQERLNKDGFYDEPARDWIDGCLKARNKGSNISEAVIAGNVMAFLLAGSDTVISGVKWLLLFTAVKLDVQKRVQKEIDYVTGGNRVPVYSDRAQMPFTQAVIAETLRWAPVLPLNVLRRALSDTQIDGHFIPKDTTVVANIWAAHMDETVWENPEEFDPTRFLSENENELKKMEAHIPFSMGKRSCTGESLARPELFLYYTMILQRYNVSIPHGTKVSFKGIARVTMVPETPSAFVFSKR